MENKITQIKTLKFPDGEMKSYQGFSCPLFHLIVTLGTSFFKEGGMKSAIQFNSLAERKAYFQTLNAYKKVQRDLVDESDSSISMLAGALLFGLVVVGLIAVGLVLLRAGV